MSEKQKATIWKVELPLQTKIAVWWLRAIAVAIALIIPIYLIYLGFEGELDGEGLWAFWIFLFVEICVAIPVSMLVLLPSMFLLTRRRNGWNMSISILCLEIIAILGLCIYNAVTDSYYQLMPNTILFASIIFLIIPLILIILDRKNYFEMLRQRELEKNTVK